MKKLALVITLTLTAVLVLSFGFFLKAGRDNFPAAQNRDTAFQPEDGDAGQQPSDEESLSDEESPAGQAVSVADTALEAAAASPAAEIPEEEDKEPLNAGGVQAPQETERLDKAYFALRAQRVTAREISLSWQGPDGGEAEEYTVQRKQASAPDSQWQTLEEAVPAGEGSALSYTDFLPESAPQQYRYRVLVGAAGKDRLASEEVLASNVLICLDPGHFDGSSELEGENLYGYTEAGFVLRLGLALQNALEQSYGIAVSMTRSTGHITLNGYSDEELDNGHISLRGEAAAGSDLFISLHTNANRDDANGYATCSQPIGINKPILLLNTVAAASPEVVDLCNAIGQNLARANSELGLSTVTEFQPAGLQSLREWSDEFNDSLDVPGTLCIRLGQAGDYYGVLQGSAKVGVPGIILEHGFHTVAEVRREAMEGSLCDRWAQADAEGIAAGLGFVALDTVSEE